MKDWTTTWRLCSKEVEMSARHTTDGLDGREAKEREKADAAWGGEASRVRTTCRRSYLEELTKFSRGDVLADTNLKPDLDIAQAQGRICRICQKAFISKSNLFKHSERTHN
jgi:hypothetical protein